MHNFGKTQRQVEEVAEQVARGDGIFVLFVNEQSREDFIYLYRQLYPKLPIPQSIVQPRLGC